MVDVREIHRGQHAAEDVLGNTQVEEGERQVAASEGPREKWLVN